VFLRRFRVDPNWKSFQWWTLALGTLDAAAVVFFTITSKAPQAENVFHGWLGLIQRAALVPFMLWLFLFALELLRRSERA
jgi:hypothetical protein